jgi:hypothetical protein
VTITAVGSFVDNTILNNDVVTLSVSPSAVGDILVVWSMVNPSGTAFPILDIACSGGGVTTWTRLIYANPPPSTDGNACAIFFGVITSTGASTVTVTVTTTTTAPSVNSVAAQQFHSSATPAWGQDGAGAGLGATSGTSGNYPSQTPVASGELYVACGFWVGESVTGSTSGYTYNNRTGSLSPYCAVVWHTSAPNPSDPAWAASNGAWTTAAALITPSAVTAQIVMIL